MTDQPERLSTDELPPGCPAWAGALFGELALESDLTSYRVVEVLGLLEATRESLTGGAMPGGWGEIDGAPEWLSMVVQAHRDADSRFGAAHVVAEIEVVENILDDLRVELLRLHCGGAVEDVGRVEDVLGREVEPEVEPDGHRNGHDEDDVTPAAPAPKGGVEREAAMTHDAAGCALLACELCDAYGSGWAAGVQGVRGSGRRPGPGRAGSLARRRHGRDGELPQP